MKSESTGGKGRPSIKAVRGTRDLLPDQTPLWNRVEATARAVFARYGFGEIRTPIFEATELFARGVGEETDIVSKEMFTWEDGERFAGKRLEQAWLQKHESKFVPHLLWQSGRASRDHADFVGTERGDDTVVIVECKANASVGTLTQVREQMNRAKAIYDNGGRIPVKYRLVVPAGRAANLGQRAAEFGIELEEVTGDFFESSQSLTLRPESTAGVVRAYIEHKLGDGGGLQKLYYIGPQFRRERPQRGRYRQFWQVGAEVIGPASSGAESPLRDAEVLEMLASLLDELGVRGMATGVEFGGQCGGPGAV